VAQTAANRPPQPAWSSTRPDGVHMPGMFRPYAAWRSSCRGTLPDLRKASLKGVGRRFVLLLIAVSVPLAGCGASAGTVHRRPVRTEVFVGNQHVFFFDGFVVRTADNTRFLVPARLDPAATDFIHPGSVNVAPSPSFPSRTTTPGFDASTGATIERPLPR
jgi:hypothetical protein